MAAEIIADYISPVPFLECAATFTNPMLALSWLMENKADVIFLDINMPIIKGHDFIRAAKRLSIYHNHCLSGICCRFV
ncbi:MAG: response regulator [Saprospiraceae bacterium]|nr:response regulator [Saprospiraceae bacterium]